MRIISGTFRGRRFEPPKNITARPTTDFAKESLFNLLQNMIDFEDITVLDLFAGTGSISFECVSRGAKYVTAVEIAHTQQNFIISTSKALNIQNLTLIRGNVFKFLNSLNQSELNHSVQQYDLIFADPPYQLPNLTDIPDCVFDSGALKEGGIFVLEHSANNSFTTHSRFLEHRKYGNVNFTFFQ